jgi:two-component system OmpR family response regulator
MTPKTSDHILIVDDDREIRELLTTYLVKNGLRVVAVPTGRHMRAALEESGPFDLIILDLMLPGEDGLTLCRDLRTGKYKATPILMLTARSEEADRILGLEMGADDYLAKPFSARELLARIRAVMRRTRMLPPNMGATEPAQKLGFGEWQVELLSLTQGREAELFERSIDLLVSRLRQRLRDDAREPRYIKTVRSEGYVLASAVEARD